MFSSDGYREVTRKMVPLSHDSGAAEVRGTGRSIQEVGAEKVRDYDEDGNSGERLLLKYEVARRSTRNEIGGMNSGR